MGPIEGGPFSMYIGLFDMGVIGIGANRICDKGGGVVWEVRWRAFV